MKNKWTLLAFLCAIFFVYTVDRSMLGILAIPIQQETGISDTSFGILNAAIFWSYAVLVPFAGLVGDRFNRVRVIGGALVAWSTFMVAAGFAGGFWSLLLLVSVLVTAPQTLYGPAANALIATHHRDTRTTALSCHQAAFYSGWFVSGAAVGGVSLLAGSWRAAYFGFGAIGLVLGLVFLAYSLTSKDEHNRPLRASSCAIRDSLQAFFGCPSALLAAVGYVAVVFVSFGYSAWGPKFVAIKFGLSPEKAATGVMFWHYAAAFAAILLAGLLTDVCVRRWPRFRLALQAASLLVAAPMLALFGCGKTLAGAFAAAAVFGLMRGLFEANAFASLFDVIRPECRASAVGYLNVIAGLVGSLAPIILGALSDRMGLSGFTYGFAFFGGVLALGASALLVSFFLTFRRDRLVGIGG